MAQYEKALHTSTGEQKLTYVVRGSKPENVDQMIAKKRQKALQRGHMILEPNGDRVWRERFECLENGRYIFHEDGERVRCELKEITMNKDGERIVRIVRIVWAALQ